jgi:O-antigen/teichoic acid export membrane protein
VGEVLSPADISSAQIVFIIAITIPLYELNAVAVAFFRALREIKTYSWFVISRELLLIAILIPLVLGGFGISGALCAFLLSYFIVDAVMFALILSRTGLSIPRFADLRPYLKFSLPTIPNSLSGWLVSSSDRYVISFMLGTASVGIYSASYGLGSVISYFSAPLSFILIPTLSKLYDEKNFSEVKVHMSYSLKYFLMFAIPGMCGLSILAVPILRILTTAEFLTVASGIVPLIALGYLCFGLYVVFSQVFIMLKQMNIIGIQWMVVAVGNLVLLSVS